ncbi:MAG: hypothetical protein HQ562_06730 [Candidatus Marinimicrobia bacterium]|nr:hypothetical protein [Candidatus Neomarinimicrobiota bacterium]
MNNREKIVYLISIVGGLLLIWLIYAPFSPGTGRTAELELAPALSPIPFHQSFVDEETCLRCHRESRQINLKGEIMEAMVMPHEAQAVCTSCHQLPNVM